MISLLLLAWPFKIGWFSGAVMKKFGLSIVPVLLLGAAMAMSAAPASASVYNYTVNGTYFKFRSVTASPLPH
jgi:hypothetical protein